jgi:hypothetical protein
MFPKKLDYLEELGFSKDEVPKLLSQDPSEDECNSFLELYLSVNLPSNVLIFMVGPYICGVEYEYEIQYSDTLERVVRFWILNIDFDFQLNQLSEDDWFLSQPWMSYFDSSQRIFKMPLRELHKIMQHLSRLSRLASYF